MGTLTSVSDVINRLSGGNSGAPETVYAFKRSAVSAAIFSNNETAGRLTTLWTADGNSGAAPTTVAAPTSATAGALPFTDATGGRTRYLIAAGTWGKPSSSSIARTFILYDRLLHIGNLSGTSTSAQTIGGTLTRNTAGTGNFIMAEIYTAIGATGTTLTASYSNTAPTSGRTTSAITWGGTGFNTAQRAMILPLAAGDSGVSAVASVTAAATTGTAGNFGIVVGRYLATFHVPNGGHGSFNNYLQSTEGPIPIDNGACLALYEVPQATSATSYDINILMQFIEA